MLRLRRALTGASVAALLAAGAAPASAASSATCNQANSTRLLTANDGEYKVWVEKVTYQTYPPDEYHICWRASNLAGGDLVIRSATSGQPEPTFDYVINDFDCATYFTIEDPIQERIELETDLTGTSYGFCFGIGANRAVRVTVEGVPYVWSPGFELWIDRDTLLGDLFCESSAAVNALYPDCDYSDSVRVF